MTWHGWAAIFVAFVVTFSLRASSFVLKSKARPGGVLDVLGKLMPVGVMVVLVVYSFHGVVQRSVAAAVVGLVVTVLLHVWRKSALVSISGGVVVYGLMLLVV